MATDEDFKINEMVAARLGARVDHLVFLKVGRDRYMHVTDHASGGGEIVTFEALVEPIKVELVPFKSAIESFVYQSVRVAELERQVAELKSENARLRADQKERKQA